MLLLAAVAFVATLPRTAFGLAVEDHAAHDGVVALRTLPFLSGEEALLDAFRVLPRTPERNPHLGAAGRKVTILPGRPSRGPLSHLPPHAATEPDRPARYCLYEAYLI